MADSMCSGTKPATSTTCAAGCGGTSTSETCNTQACPTRGVCGTAHNTNRISAPSTAAEKCSLGTASSVSGS
ncbi:MAG: hypothetical protein LBP53_01135 [Candidatus Peribacteria bacterium]|nr:hypothetical protein [Candidatus Peribacteria bacterium]